MFSLPASDLPDVVLIAYPIDVPGKITSCIVGYRMSMCLFSVANTAVPPPLVVVVEADAKVIAYWSCST